MVNRLPRFRTLGWCFIVGRGVSLFSSENLTLSPATSDACWLTSSDKIVSFDGTDRLMGAKHHPSTMREHERETYLSSHRERKLTIKTAVIDRYCRRETSVEKAMVVVARTMSCHRFSGIQDTMQKRES